MPYIRLALSSGTESDPEITEHTERALQHPELAELLDLVPNLRGELVAMLILSRSGEQMVRPIFARSNAIGSLMRQKIAPVIDPVLARIKLLT